VSKEGEKVKVGVGEDKLSPGDLVKILSAHKEVIEKQSQALQNLHQRLEITEKAVQNLAESLQNLMGQGQGSQGGQGGSLGDQIMGAIAQRLILGGASPLEKIAMGMFIRNVAFSTLFTDRLAKRMFDKEYKSMVEELEKTLSGEGIE